MTHNTFATCEHTLARRIATDYKRYLERVAMLRTFHAYPKTNFMLEKAIGSSKRNVLTEWL
jgi:hypothetical protein